MPAGKQASITRSEVFLVYQESYVPSVIYIQWIVVLWKKMAPAG